MVLGPTGDGLSWNGTLYVADTLNNRIAAIPDALFRHHSDGTGYTVSKGGHLNAPLGLAIAPNGHILTVNGGDGNMVETTPGGKRAAVKTIDNNMGGVGDPFGLAVKRCRRRLTSTTSAPTTTCSSSSSSYLIAAAPGRWPGAPARAVRPAAC